MKTAKHLWRITVDDGTHSHTYEIEGADAVSSHDLMLVVKRKLKGTLVRDWSVELDELNAEVSHGANNQKS